VSTLINLIVLLPILAAIAILLGAPARRTAFAVALFNLVGSLALLFSYDHTANDRFQFTSSFPVVSEWNLKFSLGLDGLSLVMILLTAIVTFAAIWITPKIDKRENMFYACLLFIAGGAFGAFASLDLFFFYAFHELALIPTFLLIGIWGSGDRVAAAWKITIYLALGSFVLLIGLIGLYHTVPLDLRTFDIPTLQRLAAAGKLDTTHANAIYLFLLLGFGILVSLFPFHTWAPQAYASAPAPAAMLHAGVLKKFGLYGLLRIAIPLLPDAARHWTNLLLILLVGNIIYVGLATIGQKKLDLMLGYSSVMHMGYIFLGIAALNPLGLSGAALLMFAHGLSIAALFALTGHIRQQTGTLAFSELGGLAKNAPFLAFTFALAAFASIGLPGFANFASEIMVFFGAFKSHTANNCLGGFQTAVVLALWGVVISAIYMLRAYRAVFTGNLDKRWSEVRDIAPNLRWPVVLLIATLLVGGFFPQFFLNFFTPALKAFLK
jgi:NADH-quinone oxidoreductase subunit M